MTKIKICGLTREEDIDIVNEVMPDYIGFVFAKSKREVTIEQAYLLSKKVRKEIQKVGVFVNEEIEIIYQLYQSGIITIAQLHGNESKEYCEQINFMPIIKVIPMKNLEVTKPIENLSNKKNQMILLDTATNKRFGGTGTPFDWNIIPKQLSNFFLAGGITNDNVEEAIKKTNPYGIDISSGVEINGLKDKNKIIEIVSTVRCMDKKQIVNR